MRNLNILRYGGGGVYYSSVADPWSNAAVQDRQESSSSSSKKSSESEGLIPKNLLEKLSTTGIPTDVSKFMNMLSDFERLSNFGFGVDKRQLHLLEAYANLIIKLSEYLETAEKRAAENGALDEYAVDDKGFLFVMNEKGKMEKIHASKFNASKYQALTVGELIEQRKFNPQLADNTSIITAVGKSIGIEKINDYILGIIKAVGTSETAQEAYLNLGTILGNAAKTPDASLLQALLSLAQLQLQLGSDAIFKVKDVVSLKNLNHALQYIISMLPNNMKTQLVARNVILGGKYRNSNEYAALIIQTALLAGNDMKISHDIDYAADINKAAGNGDESSKSYYSTPMEVFWDGDLNRAETIKISDPDSKNRYGISVPGNVWGMLVDDKGKDVYHVPLSFGLNQGMSKYLDFSQTYIGDKKVDPSELQNIGYENAKIAAVWLPVNSNGEVDWQGFKAYSMAEKEIHDRQITDPKTKAEIHANRGSYITYNSNGEQIPVRLVERYFMTTGYTSGNIIDGSTLNVELTGSTEDAAEDVLESIYSDNVAKYTGINGIRGRHSLNNIYATPVFIKASKTASTDARIAAGHGPKDTPHSIQDFMIKQEMMREPDTPIYAKSYGLFELQ